MIRHIHVNECDTTQDLLKEQLKHIDKGPLLISCENQKLGRGRGNHKWQAMPGSLCFSLNVGPHQVLSYTALELSVIVAMFFEHKGKALMLKWPNDLWNENFKKCGGILVQGSNSELLAGIGVNLFSDNEEFGGIFEAPFEIDKKVWCRELADYIHEHRLHDTNDLRREWLKRCGHLNQMVKITEGTRIFEGIFLGLGQYGEAELFHDAQVIRIYNGSLSLSAQG